MGRFMIQNSAAKTPWNTGYVNGSRTAAQRDFDCLYCEADKAVLVTLEKKQKVGLLYCRKCAKGFQCYITHLDCELDVYAKWVDACQEAAKKEIEEEARWKAKRMEMKEKQRIGTEAPKSVSKKRSLETDVTLPPAKKQNVAAQLTKPIDTKRRLRNKGLEPAAKKSKPNNFQTEKTPTNLKKTPSIKPASAKPPPTSSANDGHAVPEYDVKTLIERHRVGKLDTVRTEAQKMAALAKERRERKGKEWARIAAEEERRWKGVIDAAIPAAKVMRKWRLEKCLIRSLLKEEIIARRPGTEKVIADTTVAVAVISTRKRDSLDSLFGSSSEKDQPTNPHSKAEDVVATVTAPKTDDFCETLFGSFSDRGSTASILDVPTPTGSPELSPSNVEERPIPTIKIEFVETSETMEEVEEEYNAPFGSPSDEQSG